MIQVFLGQEKRFNKQGYLYKYIYFFDTIESEVWIINPLTNYMKKTDNSIMIELHYKDDQRERIHKNLIDWEE